MLRVRFGMSRAQRKVAAMAAGMEVANEVALKHAGEKIVKAIQETLDRQMVEGPPLAQKTIMLKGHSMKLIDTHLMRNNVEARIDGNAVVVGVHKDAPENRGIIAAVHEHGNESLPRRAFIEPSWNRVKRQVLKEYDREIQLQLIALSKIT